MSDITVTLAIRSTPDAVWEALTSAAISPAYYMGFQAEFDLTPGAPYRYSAGGGAMITGSVVAVDAPTRLVTMFNGAWDPAVAALPESEVTFEIIDPFMPMPGIVFLSCTHTGLPDGPVTSHLELGWVTILSGLKTLLETGAPLVGAPA